jgi:hypothetical protein
VLLWLEEDRWTYQKVGREDQAYLLKQTLTAAELHYLVEVPDESLAAPDLQDHVDVLDEFLAAPDLQDHVDVPDEFLAAPDLQDHVDVPDEFLAAPDLQDHVDVPDEFLAAPDLQDQVGLPDKSFAAPSPSVLAVPTEEPDVAPDLPKPVPEMERRGPSRWLIIALVIIGLCFAAAVVALLVANQLGF